MSNGLKQADTVVNAKVHKNGRSGARNSNIELLRVISMLMICALHYAYQGGLLKTLIPTDSNYKLVWLIEAFCYVSVNCYVLISGYFLSASNPKPYKISRTIIETVFYSVGMYVLFCALGLEKFSVTALIAGYLFPITHGSYWFATVYVVLYLVSPYINKLIYNMEKKEYRNLLITLTIVLSAISTIVPFSGNVLGKDSGYSLIWFVYLYLVAGYIRKFEIKFKCTYSLIVYFGASFLTFFAKMIQVYILKREYWNLYNYTSLSVLIASVGLFMFFVCLPKKENRLWQILGSTTFGVFLYHTHYIMRDKVLWQMLVKPLSVCYSPTLKFLLHFVISVFAIFAVGAVIDLFRQLIFKIVIDIYHQLKKTNKSVDNKSA